jgi:hypothetical protein
MNLTDIYRVLHFTAMDYTFFSAVYRTFSKTDHTLGHKANLNKYRIIKSILCMVTDHNGKKLEVNSKENYKNHSNTWRLKTHF